MRRLHTSGRLSQLLNVLHAWPMLRPRAALGRLSLAAAHQNRRLRAYATVAPRHT